jgi:hypothetical protein
MSPVIAGVLVTAATFCGSIVGIWLNSIIPDHHLDSDSKDTVKVGIGLVATMTALILGLITASTKGSYDSVDRAVKQSAMHALTLDRILARYGPETAELRTGLKRAIERRIDMVWLEESNYGLTVDPMASGSAFEAEKLGDDIRNLVPHTDAQKDLQGRALDLAEQLLEERWTIFSDNGSHVPYPFIVVLSVWLTVIFVSFGMFSPRNITVATVLFICATSIGSAIFIILELDTPFGGVLRISPEPLKFAVSHMNK